MPEIGFSRPRVPGYFYVRLESRSAESDVLIITSERRKVRLAGKSLAEFFEHVIPLLDGRRTFAEIHQATERLFTQSDLVASLRLLAEYGLLEDGPPAADLSEREARLAPQLNFFREFGLGAIAQQRLTESTVTVVGASGAGAYAAQALAAAGVGTLRLIDAAPAAFSDVYLSPLFTLSDVGSARVDALGRKLLDSSPETRLEKQTEWIHSEAEAAAAIRGSDFVVCGVDAGLSAVLYHLNRACLASGIRWTSASVSGFEGVLGPTIFPRETACYLCYKMRSVACAENPEEEFRFQQFLDQRQRDDSSQRENLVFAAGIIGNLLGLEAMKCLLDGFNPAAAGGILTIDFLTMEMTRHTVLKKPWCPVCFR